LLLKALPEVNDFYSTLLTVRQTFKNNGVWVDSFDFSPGNIGRPETVNSKKAPGLSPLTVSINFSSSLTNLEKLINEIERALPVMSVSDVNFDQVQSSSASATLSLKGKMTIRSFHKPLPPSLDKVDKPLGKVSNKDRELIEKLRAFIQIQTTEPSVGSSEGPVSVGRENPFSL
jgi:hypothetical protein